MEKIKLANLIKKNYCFSGIKIGERHIFNKNGFCINCFKKKKRLMKILQIRKSKIFLGTIGFIILLKKNLVINILIIQKLLIIFKKF